MSVFVGQRQRVIQSQTSRQAVEEEQIQRFDAHQRMQHILMMSTFVVLALTGLPQRFSEMGASQWWVNALGGLEAVRAIHRTAGVIMLIDCVYHASYLFVRIGVQGRLGGLQMIPRPQDARDAIQMARYFLGVSRERPQFGRFSYLEKFDYWAVFWGIAVIGGSGVVLMFAVAATKVLPGQAIPLALTVHGDEAVLAVGWIAIVHMFNAHLAPWVFPMNKSIFTGKVPVHRYAEEHPLEYARMAAGQRTAGAHGIDACEQAHPQEEPRSVEAAPPVPQGAVAVAAHLVEALPVERPVAPRGGLEVAADES